jgi:6-phosphofructokinase 1
MAYGNIALNLLLEGVSGKLVVLKNGCYDSIPLDAIAGVKKVVNVEQDYNIDRLRPHYKNFEHKPFFIL